MGFEKNNLPGLFNGSFHHFVKSIDSFFDESLKHLDSFLSQNVFPVEWYETESDMIIEADLPGHKREHIQVEVLGNQLRIAVEHSDMTTVHHEQVYSHRKQSLQKIERCLTLPFSISEKDTHATYKNGLLRIITPKQPHDKRFVDIE